MSKALREVLSDLPRRIGGARVFVRPGGVPLTLPEVARAFRVAQKLSGIREELNPYTIRHTFASWLAIKGTPIRTIQELLGHKDLRMTLRYAHLSPAHLAEAVETIGAVEKSNRLRVGCASNESEGAETEAKPSESSGSPYENRTRISALRGPRPNR
jgi:integrase